MTRGSRSRECGGQLNKVVAGLLYVLLASMNAIGQEAGSSGGSTSITCSPPADLSEAVRGGLFESGTQIVYASLPFKGSGNTTCWHVVVAADCSMLEPGVSSTKNATMKVQLQVLREIGDSSQQYEVVDYLTTGVDIKSMECLDVEQSRQITMSFDAKLRYSSGDFPGIYFQSQGEVGVAYGGKYLTCNSLVSPLTPITTWNRGKSQATRQMEFSFPGGEICFDPPLFTVSVIADRTDSSLVVPTLSSQVADTEHIPVATSTTTSTGTVQPPLTTVEDGSTAITCLPPADLSEAVRGGLFESGTQIVYTSLPFKGSGNTTCWHVVVAADCSMLEPGVLSTKNATMKVQLQVLREIGDSLRQYEVVDYLTTGADIKSMECLDVEQSRQITMSFDAKLSYSNGDFPGIYFTLQGEVGVAYGGTQTTCNSLVNLLTPITTWNRGKSQATRQMEVSFPGGEVCFHQPLFTVSVIANKTDSPLAISTLSSQVAETEHINPIATSTATSPGAFQPPLTTIEVSVIADSTDSPLPVPTLSSQVADTERIPVATSTSATTSTGTVQPPLTTVEVIGMNNANPVRADITIIGAAAATAMLTVLIATAIIIVMIIVGLLCYRKRNVRAYQLKANTGTDSMKKPPVSAVVRRYKGSSDLKCGEIICNQAADYLTPVSSGGPTLDKTNYINLGSTGKGDTMETIGEYQVMYPVPEVVLDRSPCYGWVVPTLDQRNNLQQDDSTEGIYSTLEPYYAESSLSGPVANEQAQTCYSNMPGINDTYDIDVTESDSYWTPSTVEEELYSQLNQWNYREIPRSIVAVGKKLGEGQFGEVYSGQLQSTQNGPARDVAVKLVKSGSPQEERVKLLQEAAILGQFRHRHIVWLAGVVTLGEPKMIVMELATGGDLRGYLNQTKQTLAREGEGGIPHLPRLLLKFCHQVAEGLSFLASKSFVHRDIAARNILLDQELNCKISDFGMSRDLEEETYYVTKGGQIPIKWTAPEAILHKKYSTSSDVWSYGMLMYEIWSLGRRPFQSIPIQQVAQILNENAGYCQPPPPGCPRAVYAIMVDCWNPDHNARPSAIGAVVKLTQPESTLLAWTDEDKEALLGGCKLGAPPEMSENLFKDLQETYA